MTDPYRPEGSDQPWQRNGGNEPSSFGNPPHVDPAYAGQLPSYPAGYPPREPNPTTQLPRQHWDSSSPPPGGPSGGGGVVVGVRLGIGVLGAVGSGETGVTVAEFCPEPLAITSAITMPTTSSTAAPATSHSQFGNRGGSGGPPSPPGGAPPPAPPECAGSQCCRGS
jgi:hypothetical protein